MLSGLTTLKRILEDARWEANLEKIKGLESFPLETPPADLATLYTNKVVYLAQGLRRASRWEDLHSLLMHFHFLEGTKKDVHRKLTWLLSF